MTSTDSNLPHNALADEVHLRRLSMFIDVVYALIFYHMFNTYLPLIEDMTWTTKPYGLLSLLAEKNIELLRIVIGTGLALIYWHNNNKFFKRLVRTNGTHVTFSLIQLVLIILYVYFAIADPELVSISSPALQAASLALAGFLGIISWRYAIKNGLVRPEISEIELDNTVKDNFLEPLTATVCVGLAFVGPTVWTLGWFVIPLIISFILKKLDKKKLSKA